MIGALVLAAVVAQAHPELCQTFLLTHGGPTEFCQADGSGVAIVSQPAEKPKGIDPAFTVALADRMADHAFRIGIGASADLFSTAWGLKRCPSCGEQNPLGFSVEARVALKSALAIGSMTAAWKLEKGGHSNGAKWLSRGALAVSLAATVNNVVHGIRRK